MCKLFYSTAVMLPSVESTHPISDTEQNKRLPQHNACATTLHSQDGVSQVISKHFF